MVYYRIILVGFKLGKPKGTKEEELSEQEEEDHQKTEKKWVGNIFLLVPLFLFTYSPQYHLLLNFLCFSDMLKLVACFKKSPTMTYQDKGKGIIKEDVLKKRK